MGWDGVGCDGMRCQRQKKEKMRMIIKEEMRSNTDGGKRRRKKDWRSECSKQETREN